MPYEFNGMDLASIGIIVDHVPNITKANKRISTYTVPGRNGFLAVDEGTYEPFVLTLQCHINTDDFDIDVVKDTLDGYGTLSLDGEREYTAFVNNQIDFTKVAQMPFRRFALQFMVNPIAQSYESTTVNITTSGQHINIFDANATMYPILTIEGDGDLAISINNQTFHLTASSSETYTLDCELKEITDSNGLNASSLMYGDFPSLIAGTNTVEYTGDVTSFTIEYRRAWL